MSALAGEYMGDQGGSTGNIKIHNRKHINAYTQGSRKEQWGGEGGGNSPASPGARSPSLSEQFRLPAAFQKL